MNLKANKRKFLARVMLFVIVMMSAFSLSGCIYRKVDRVFVFKSHGEYLEFIERYNSKNDGSVFTFLSFDFDKNTNVKAYGYSLSTMGKIKRSLITQETEKMEIYDDDHSQNNGFRCKMVFYANDVALNGESMSDEYQISVYYNTRSDYNYYQDDVMTMNYVGTYKMDDYDSFDELTNLYGYDWDYFNHFIDVRTESSKEIEKFYTYTYVYQININHKNEATVIIACDNELNDEKLNEIESLLLDNVVIINTEG